MLASHLLAWGSLGFAEMLVIFLVALLLFGDRLPKVARNLGRSMNEFKRGMQDGVQDDPSAKPNAAPPQPKPPAGTPGS